MASVKRPPRASAGAPPSTPLFRAAAVAYHGAQTFGTTRLAHGVPVGALTALLATIACAAIAFVTLGEYARKESVQGYLEPDLGAIRVFAPRSGIVSDIRVAIGDSVRRGAVLFNVTDLQSLSDGADADREMLERFAAERTELEAARDREPARAAAELTGLRSQLATLDRQIAAATRWIAVQTEQSALAAAQTAALDGLHVRGAIATVEWLAQRERLLQPRERLQSTQQTHERLLGERAAVAERLARAPLDSADRSADFGARLAALERAAVALRVRRAFAVRAPVEGRVVAVSCRVGGPAAPNEAALTLIPKGSTLVGRALIPTTAIGFVTPGQQVRIRYDAFPHQHFGVHRAVVRDVARSVLFEGDAYGPLRVTAPGYPATLALERQTVVADARAVPLQSGMAFSADIVLERRRIVEWLFEPLLRMRGRA
jgi:membrane fusion protein